MRRDRWLWLILSVHVLLLGIMAVRDAPSLDELAHLSAGLSHIQEGSFSLYRVNPPIARMAGAVIPTLLGAESATHGAIYGPGARGDFDVASAFLMENDDRTVFGVPKAFVYLVVARFSLIPLSILGALVCYQWAIYETGNRRSALAAVLLWCFCPNILAWAHTLHPDLAATSFGLLLLFAFRLWLDRPTVGGALFTGVCLGLALGSKGTWVFALVLLPTLWLVYVILHRGKSRSIWREAGRLLLILLVGVGFLNAIYQFHGTFQRLGTYQFRSSRLAGVEPANDWDPALANRFRNTPLATVPVPFPSDYVLGIDWIKWELERGYPSFLRGEWKQGGWWYYYLYALLMKTPLGTIGLLFIAFAVMAIDVRDPKVLFDRLYLGTIPVFFLVLVSSQTGFNHHLRYILPILPFLYLLIAVTLFDHDNGSSSWGDRIVWTFLLASVVASAVTVPNSISFFNSLAGGPRNGYRHLRGSNVDNGQDLYQVIRWQKAHPDRRPLHYAHSVVIINPGFDGTEFARVPDDVRSASMAAGWYAVCADVMHRYPYLDSLEPDELIGNSVLVFHITDAQIARFRSRAAIDAERSLD